MGAPAEHPSLTPVPRLRPAEGAGRGFYEQALPGKERLLFRRARRERGLADEIALLRLQVYLLLQSKDGSSEQDLLPSTTRLIDLLIKALRAQAAGAEAEQGGLERWLEEEGAKVLAEARKAAE